jgi:hypothetical protein
MQGEDFSTRIHDIEQIQFKDWHTSTTLTGTTTIPDTEKIKTYYCNGNFTVTLPSAANTQDKIIDIISISSSDVTIAAAGSDTIDGLTLDPVTENKWNYITLKSDGTSDWAILKTNFWFSSCQYWISVAQNINHATNTVIQFDTKVHDRLDEFEIVPATTWRFKPKYDGRYNIYLNVGYGTITTGGWPIWAQIWKNAATDSQTIFFTVTAGPHEEHVFAWAKTDLLTTDYIEFKARQNSGVVKQLINNIYTTKFFVEREDR